MAHFVYVNDGSKVPADVRVFENRFGQFEDKDGRVVTKVLDNADGFPLAPPPPKTDYFADLASKLASIESKLDKLLAK